MDMSSSDRIVNKILNDAKAEAERILSQAKAEAEALKEEARRRAASEVEAIVMKHREALEEEARRRVMEARIKAKERWLKEREDLINRAIERVKDRLASFVESPSYVKALESLIEEAAVAIGGGDLLVQLNERDSKLNLNLDSIAKKVSAKIGVDTRLELSDTKAKCIGGAIVSTRDGSFIYDNTLESRLERQASAMRITASKILFSEVQA